MSCTHCLGHVSTHTCRHQGLGELADRGVGSARSSARNEVLGALPHQVGCPSRTTHTYTRTFIHTYIHPHIQTRTHTNTHTQTCTYTNPSTTQTQAAHPSTQGWPRRALQAASRRQRRKMAGLVKHALPSHVPTVMAENSTSLSGLHAPSETMGRCGKIRCTVLRCTCTS
jgi:hypothetical protein